MKFVQIIILLLVLSMTFCERSQRRGPKTDKAKKIFGKVKEVAKDIAKKVGKAIKVGAKWAWENRKELFDTAEQAVAFGKSLQKSIRKQLRIRRLA